MKRTALLEKAIKRATLIDSQIHDKTVLSNKCDFSCNGHILLNGTRLTDIGIQQVCRIFKIPPQWIAVKQQLEDGVHLTESFKRHAQNLPAVKLILREYRDREIIAVWPERTVNLDMLPVLRIVQEHLAPLTHQFEIQITRQILRLFAVLKGKRNTGFRPGIYISTSNDGSFGIKVSTGYGDGKLFCPVGEISSFKRLESEEGGLEHRFTKTLNLLTEQRLTVLKNMQRSLQRLKDLKIKENFNSLLESGRKLLTYPQRCDTLLLAYSQGDSLAGYWESLLRVANDVALAGDPFTSHQLQAAAGKLLTNPDLANTLSKSNYS